MSDFGEALRGSLAQKEAVVRDAAERQEEERRAAEKQFFEVDTATAALLEDVFGPLVAEFQTVMEAEGVLCRGRSRHERPGPYRPDAGQQALVYAALGNVRGRPRYQIRLAAHVGRTGIIELSAECVHETPVGYPHPPARRALVELPRASALATAIDAESARQWCAEVLKRCAEALMEANSRPAPAPVHAPLAGVPGLDTIAVPATA